MTDTFRKMLAEAEKRIPFYSGSWVNFLPSDPGMTILEILTYYQAAQRDRMEELPGEVTENLLKMAGFSRKKEENATLYVKPENTGRGIRIEKGQKFRTCGLCFEAGEEIDHFRGRLSGVFRMMEGKTKEILELREGVPLHAEIFGRHPKKGDSVYFLFDDLPETGGNFEVLLYVDVWKDDYRNSFLPGDKEEEFCFAELSFACYNGREFEAVACEDETYGFLKDGEIRLRLRKEQGQTVEVSGRRGYLFRCTLVQADYDIPPSVTEVYGPLIRLEQRDTKICTRDKETCFATPDMSVYAELGILYGYDGQEFDISGIGVLDGTSLRLMAEGGEREFAPGDPEFCYEYDRGRKKIRILDAGGYEGGRVWISRCAVTAGALGNIRKGNRLSSRCGREEIYFFNPLEGKGGRDYETLEETRKRFLRDLRTPVSAVTREDYEYLAKRVPGLCIRKARACCDAADRSIQVVILPYGREEYPTLPQIYQRRILRYLEGRKLLNTKVKVIPPIYLRADVRVKVRQKKRGREAEREAEIRRMLKEALDYRRNKAGIGDPISYAGLFEKIESLPWAADVCRLEILPEGEGGGARYPGDDILLPERGVCVPGRICVELI